MPPKKKETPCAANTEHSTFEKLKEQPILKIKEFIEHEEPQPATYYEDNYVEYIDNEYNTENDNDNETCSISSTSSLGNSKEKEFEEHNVNYSFICKLNQSKKKTGKLDQLTFEEYEDELED